MDWSADAINSTEEIIGHDTFAAMLNIDGEIQVGDQVYKYTDVGMFAVSDAKYSQLNNYLDHIGISRSLLNPSDSVIRQQFLNENQSAAKSAPVKQGDVIFYGAYQKCNWSGDECGDTRDSVETKQAQNLSPENSSNSTVSKLFYPGDEFCDLSNEDCTESSGGGSSGGGGGGGTNSNPLYGLEGYVKSLQPCSPSSGIFGDIFGVNKVCIDRYESKQRVKTKAFNYDYFIVYHTGVKVKHQKKGWAGFWVQQDTDVVAFGGRKIQFKYDVTPVLAGGLAGINLQENKITSKNIGQQWTLNSNFYTNPFGYSNVTSTIDYSTNLYPTVFQDDLTIETHGDNAILDSLISQGEKQATSEKLNEYFWTNLRTGVKHAVGSITFNSNYNPPLNTTLAYKNAEYGKIYVQKSFYQNCLNCSKVDKTVDFGFLLSFNSNPEDNWNISVGVETDQVLAPKDYSVTVYGAAKRNGVWHGSLIDF